MYMDLCGGQLEHSIPHPTRSEERLYLLFNYTHNFKNIYNNFVNKERMNNPAAGFENILGTTCTAYFSSVKRLYAIEEDKALKVASKMKKSSLNSSSIAKTSPQHALSKCIVKIKHLFNRVCTFMLYEQFSCFSTVETPHVQFLHSLIIFLPFTDSLMFASSAKIERLR